MDSKNERILGVPDGYKQTEIGIIPYDWELISYDRAFLFLSTATYSRADLSGNESVKYIHYGDIHTRFEHFIDLNTELPTISDGLIKNYDFIKNGDIVMADTSEDYEGICKSVEIINFDNVSAISGLHTYLFRDKDNFFVDGFKAYLSENALVQKSFKRLATGMKVFGVSKTNLKTVLIPRPPLNEQKAIATVLTDTDDLINTVKTLIAKKKAIKQGTMQELLTGKKRLEGFSGEWETRKLGELIGKITTGKLDANAMVEDGKYRFYTCAKEYYKINEYVFDTEALLISGNGANVGYIHYFKGKFNAYQRTYILIDFLGDIFFMKSILDKFFKIRIEKEVSAGSTPFIKKDTITEMQINLPKDIKEQEAIAQILNDMSEEIESLETQLQKTQNLKQGMMQELLTGKTRLRNIPAYEIEDTMLMAAEPNETYTKPTNID